MARFGVFAMLLALSASITTVRATTFMAQDFAGVVSTTPVIVRGTVGMSYADWSRLADNSRRIYTFYELQITEVLKGDVSGSTLIFRELGGEKDGTGMTIAGAAHFDRGEDVVVMLSDKNPDGSYDLRSFMMGKLTVQHDDADGADVLKGPALADQKPGELLHGDEGQDASPRPSPQPRKRWTLDSLRQLIGGSRAHTARPSPAPATSPKVSQGADAPASPSGEAEEESPAPASGGIGTGWYLAAFALGLGGGSAIFAFRRSLKNRKRK